MCVSSRVGMHGSVSGPAGIVSARSILLRPFGYADSHSGRISKLFCRTSGIFQIRKLWESNYVGCCGIPNATREETP